MNKLKKKLKVKNWEDWFSHCIDDVEEHLDRTLDLVEIFNLNFKAMARNT